MSILGDSGEYEYLTETVQMSAHIDGLLVEIGLREGLGTKTIIDACLEYRPGSTVVSIDPYGSILYKPREHMEPCRLDYTDDMHKQCMADMWAYIIGKNVLWIPLKMTDEYYFNRFVDGIEVYDLETKVINKYAMVHLDGPHSVVDIRSELSFFNNRMVSGAVIVVDDCSEDFINVENLKQLFVDFGWELLKIGFKKGIWRKS